MLPNVTHRLELAALLPAVEGLKAALQAAQFPLDMPEAGPARIEQRAVLAQLDDYVVPRLNSMDAPLLAVVGGSTGAGKSTLVNSLLGQAVSRSGVLRPTTRAPVLVHHPDDVRWFSGSRVLPGLARHTGGEPDADRAGPITSLRLVPSPALPVGLALLDAPDIDSVVSANRQLAKQLLAAADLWIFVTTAARYADAVPWELLRGAAQRGAVVAIVLDRVPPGAVDEVRPHLAQMMGERGLTSSPLFWMPETSTDEAGLLDPAVVEPVRSWLVALAKDAAARQAVVRRTLGGALDALRPRTLGLVSAMQAQQESLAQLQREVDEAYVGAVAAIEHGLSDGTLLRGEVLARWQEFAGTGELVRSIETAISRWRDRLTAAVTGRPAPVEDLEEALQSGVEALITDQAQGAAAQAVRRWRSVAGGERLAGQHPDLAVPAPGLEERVARAVRDWQGYVLDLVRGEGGDRRATARALSFGVNGLGVLLMLVVFSQTAGLTGAEVGISGGTAVLAQRLLEAVFGDQAVRSLASKAKVDLLRRSAAVLAVDRARIDDVLAGLGDPGRQAAALRAAAETVEAAR